MPDNLIVKDANAVNQTVRTVEVAGVHTPIHRIDGYDTSDDMLKVKSVQKKWRDSFTRPLTDLWDVTTSGGVTATNSAGVLTIASGTTAAGFAELLSKETFTIPFRTMFGVQSGATRQANTHHIVEAVSVDPVTGVPDGRHAMSIDIGGAASTTVTQAIYEVQNGGLAPLASAAVTIVTTATYSVLELEPFTDEAYFHSRTLDATSGRANSYVRHQQIPDANAVYKLRIRSLNHAAWRTITNVVAGTGGVIRITSTAHGYTGTPTVWVEALNGVLNGTSPVRGNYAISVVDANTIELTGTTFAGTYVSGSGRMALGSAPAAGINLQFQFINCQDYAELTAEITAGRGQAVEGQAIAARLVASTAAIGTVSLTGTLPAIVGQAAEDAVASGNPVMVSGLAATALPANTIVAGDVVRPRFSLSGQLVQKPFAPGDLDFQVNATVTTNTQTAIRAAQTTGIRQNITSITYQNTNATATTLTIQDGATTLITFSVPASMANPVQLQFLTPLRGTAATALNYTAGTTGANVLLNVTGFNSY